MPEKKKIKTSKFFKYFISIIFVYLIINQIFVFIEGRTILEREHQVNYLEKPINMSDAFFYDKNGNKLKFSDFNYDISILAIWASWCKYCAQEIPKLSQYISMFKLENFGVYSVVEPKDTPQKIDKFYQKFNVNNSLTTFFDYEVNVFRNARIKGVPSFFLVDKDYNIIAIFSPDLESDSLFSLLREVSKKK